MGRGVSGIIEEAGGPAEVSEYDDFMERLESAHSWEQLTTCRQ